MSTTLLELTRSLHEDIERFQQGIRDELDYQPRNFRENIFQTHRVAKYLEAILDSGKKLASIYEDKDGARREELNSMAGQQPHVFSPFYDRLREIKEYHRRFPDAGKGDTPDQHLYFDEDEVATMFSGEEAWGKALDLHYYFDTYLNLKSIKNHRTDYVTYLDNFYKFTDHFEQKEDPKYQKYVKDVSDYLVSFLKKSQPLLDLEKFISDITSEFDRKWATGEFTGWSTPAEKDDKKKDLVKPSADEADPLFCKACHKKFAKETVFEAHKTGKKHIQAQQKLNDLAAARPDAALKETYGHEYLISFLCSKTLMEQIANTKINIQKKQSMTATEILNALAAEEEEEEMEDDYDPDMEEPAMKMTIENYPVGWDGKPIPYWLYKLHGLGVEYKCEICGNTSYWGRKAYENHFQEWRHAFGMRCLGIPNTRHFHDITKLNDAIALWNKLRKDKWEEAWKPEQEEEYEDREGNVFNKKTYEDLKRQGLL